MSKHAPVGGDVVVERLEGERVVVGQVVDGHDVEQVERLIDVKLLATLTTPALQEQAVAVCLEQGTLRRHAERVIARYNAELAQARAKIGGLLEGKSIAIAGADSACVSPPKNIGPVTPCAARYSAIACVMARMCASVNEPLSGEPRWPLVPKLTSCAGSLRSGRCS